MKIGIDARRTSGTRGAGVGVMTKGLLSSMAQVDPANEYILFNQRIGNLIDRGPVFAFLVPILVDYIHKQFILPFTLGLRRIDVFLCTAQPGLFWAPCPSVVYISDVPENFESSVGSPLWNLLVRYVIPMTARRATHIITVSKHSKGDLIEKIGIPPERISVVYHGVNSSRFFPMDRANAYQVIRQRHSLKKMVLLTVLSSFAPRKNLQGLVKAYSLLPSETRQKTSLVVVGHDDGWLKIKRELYDSISQEMLDSIVITGYVEDELLPVYYNAADVFVFPSLHEGFGLPVLEAMSCGTPVVCSNTASLPEVIGKVGVLVNPHNAMEMANALGILLEDIMLRNRFSEAGRARAMKFTPQREATQVLQVLRNVVSGERD